MTEDIDIEIDILEEGLGFMVAEGLVRDECCTKSCGAWL